MNAVLLPDSRVSSTVCRTSAHILTPWLRCQPAPILLASVGTCDSWNEGLDTRLSMGRIPGPGLSSLRLRVKYTYISSHIMQTFISPSYARIRRSYWPLLAGCVSSKPRCSYPWDPGLYGDRACVL